MIAHSKKAYNLNDIQQAQPFDFIYNTNLKAYSFNVWKLLDQYWLIEYKENLIDYMRTFCKEYNHITFWMLKWNVHYSLNEYSEEGPFNSHDNRSLFQLAQGDAKSYFSSWKNMHDDFERWSTREKKWKLVHTKEEINNRKLYLHRKYQKIHRKQKYLAYFIGDEHTINRRMMIKNWYLYLPIINNSVNRRIKIQIDKVPMIYWKQTFQLTINANWKLIATMMYHKKQNKNRKTKWVVGIDLWVKYIDCVKIDKNWCMRGKKSFPLWQIPNMNTKQKRVALLKLMLEIKQWAWAYRHFVFENLDLKDIKKTRRTSNFLYALIRKYSYMLWNDVKFVNPAYTSYIGLKKYTGYWFSTKHHWKSKDQSAAYVIGRRWLWFKEKIPPWLFEKLPGDIQCKKSNWNLWHYIKRNKIEEK